MIAAWGGSMTDRLLLASAAFGALMCSHAQASEIDLIDNAFKPIQFADVWSGFYLGGTMGISVIDAKYDVTSTNFDTLAGSQNFAEPGPLG